MTARSYDALLLVSFGGPERSEDVMPFLERVTSGRGVPPARLARVAEQYAVVGGASPINGQNRALLTELREALDIPVYWGNRNASPFIAEALAQMRDDGVQRALAFVTSAYGSYSGCRQYREDIARAQAEVGVGAPEVHKLRAFYNHPLFVDPCAAAIRAARDRLSVEQRDGAHVLFTAHSLPIAMARSSPYVPQLQEAARLVAAASEVRSWSLAWQSRSGAPNVPWLEPDIAEALRSLVPQGISEAQAASGEQAVSGAQAVSEAQGVSSAVIVAPIGFVSDHMEVVYDLDTVAIPAARRDGLLVERAATPGLALTPLICALVGERRAGNPRAFLGSRGPAHDGCPLTCCAAPL